MLEIKEFLSSNKIKPLRYKQNGNTTLIETDNNKLILKKSKMNKEMFDFLETRSFNYYPKVIAYDEDYMLSEYIEETKIPKETKMQDLLDLVSLLHNKTTIYKEIDKNKVEEIYEDINNNIIHLDGYYSDIMTIIESKVFMAPHEYTLARNISLVYKSITTSKMYIDKWYQLVKDDTKERNVLIHNNLEIDHFIKNKNSYLINWDKSRIDMPIFDIYKLINRSYKDFSYEEIISHYEKNYPLKETEKNLLLSLLLLPDKIEFETDIYENTKMVTNMVKKLVNINNYITTIS